MSQRDRVSCLPARLKEARRSAGLSIAELADQAQFHKNGIRDYENGLSEPCQGTLVRLCDVLDVSADWLLGLARPSEGTKHGETLRPYARAFRAAKRIAAIALKREAPPEWLRDVAAVICQEMGDPTPPRELPMVT